MSPERRGVPLRRRLPGLSALLQQNPRILDGQRAANSWLGPSAAVSERLTCETVAALAGHGDLLHTSRGVIPGFSPLWGRQRA
nr:hypothetical protein BDOA9_0148690 [Bradyrhizobium sp. DOA9]